LDAISLKDGMGLGDSDYPDRVAQLLFLAKVRDGKQYDHILNPFSTERDGTGRYIKLIDRRPSVRTGLCRVVVNDSVSLLFGEGRFPAVHSGDENTRNRIRALLSETRLTEVMNAAAVTGSIGSVAILMRVLQSRVFFEVKDTTFLTPTWRLDAPDTLEKVTERYKIPSSKLNALGYALDEEGIYWFQRDWDAEGELWYLPQTIQDARDGIPPVLDDARSVSHGLGFVPMVWIRNLPSAEEADGECTFEAAISTVMEMDYQLSQAGRGLKYASDPTLLIKEPAISEGGDIVRSAAEAIVVSKDGDAKLLEIGGTASQAVVDYVRCLREAALEAIHGNRTNVDKLNGAQSGRALEMMNQGLIWLADRLRITYGQNGLLSLIGLVCQASQKVTLKIDGDFVSGLDGNGLSLLWPRFFSPSYSEKFQEAQAYVTLRTEGLISRERAIAKMAPDNDVEDITEELDKIAADLAADDARLRRQGAQTQNHETL
jgi:hypothetical protein